MRLALMLLCAALSAHATTFFITIAGLGGETDYEQRFTAWALAIDHTLRATGGEIDVETLHGPNATKDNLRGRLEAIAKRAKAQDQIVLMVIGHGTFDGVDYKLNLPGPDISATELAGILDRIPTPHQLVVNMTSASGGSIHALQKPTRTVITATKTGTEKNATVFARYWSDALKDASADTDKNEVITAVEAFRFAETKTKNYFESQKRLATEHALIDGGEAQGALNASKFALLRLGSIQRAAQDPAKQELLAKREKLEQQIEQIKFEKAAMQVDDYKKQLSALLLELARTQAELDK